MKHPSYLLNPGDLFQVEPDRVLYATGHTKTPFERRMGRVGRRQAKAERLAEAERAEGGAPEVEAESKETAAKEDVKETKKEDTKETLQALLAQAKAVTVSYTHLRAHETDSYLVCRLLLEKKKYAVFCLKKKNSFFFFFFLMIRRQPRSTHCISSAASDVYKRQYQGFDVSEFF